MQYTRPDIILHLEVLKAVLKVFDENANGPLHMIRTAAAAWSRGVADVATCS